MKTLQIEVTFLVQKVAGGEYDYIMSGYLCRMENLNSFDFLAAIENTKRDLHWCNDVIFSGIEIR